MIPVAPKTKSEKKMVATVLNRSRSCVYRIPQRLLDVLLDGGPALFPLVSYEELLFECFV
jgi:hypothetical protein